MIKKIFNPFGFAVSSILILLIWWVIWLSKTEVKRKSLPSNLELIGEMRHGYKIHEFKYKNHDYLIIDHKGIIHAESCACKKMLDNTPSKL